MFENVFSLATLDKALVIWKMSKVLGEYSCWEYPTIGQKTARSKSSPSLRYDFTYEEICNCLRTFFDEQAKKPLDWDFVKLKVAYDKILKLKEC